MSSNTVKTSGSKHPQREVEQQRAGRVLERGAPHYFHQPRPDNHTALPQLLDCGPNLEETLGF